MGVKPATTTQGVLFDRDGTLAVDVPYNGEPSRVRLMPSAVDAVRLLRRHGLGIGVVTNQSGIGRGLLTKQRVESVNARVDTLLGGLDTWRVCPHAPTDRCGCRKPAPGLVKTAAGDLGLDPAEIVLIGDIGADIEAAESAGAVGILVPTPVTEPGEIAGARLVAPTVLAATELVLQGTLT